MEEPVVRVMKIRNSGKIRKQTTWDRGKQGDVQAGNGFRDPS